MQPFFHSSKIAQLTGGFALIVGILSLCGWYFDIVFFRSFAIQFSSMSQSTAACFMAVGTALLLHTAGKVWLGRILGIIIIVVAGLTLIEIVFAVDFGIDRLLFSPDHLMYPHLERMSPITASNMLLLGIVLTSGIGRSSRINALLMLTIANFAGLGLLGLLYNVSSVYALPIYRSMALTTAITFVVLAAGYFYSQPSPFLTTLMSNTSAGLTGRRLIPLVVIVPMVLGWIMTELSRIGVFDASLGFALLVMLTTVVFAMVISMTMRAQYAEEMVREAAAKNALELALHRERDRLLNEFVTNTLHDLRTPLSSIGTSAYIAGRTSDPEKRLARLDQIQVQVKQIGGLLDQFADMVRLNQVEAVILTPTCLNPLLERIASEYRPAAERKGVVLNAELLTDLPLVPAAELLLRTALIQVVNNAMRYTPKGGKITLRTRCAGNQALIEVVDTGEGIAPAALQHVFDVQFKGNAARTPDGSTGGFGLSMVKRILELHHGRAEIESTVGQGTTLRLSLPIHTAA